MPTRAAVSMDQAIRDITDLAEHGLTLARTRLPGITLESARFSVVPEPDGDGELCLQVQDTKATGGVNSVILDGGFETYVISFMEEMARIYYERSA